MAKFPVGAPVRKVVKTFESLGFQLVREGNHIAIFNNVAITLPSDSLLATPR